MRTGTPGPAKSLVAFTSTKSPSVSTTAASSPVEPDEMAIATQTSRPDRRRLGSRMLAAA